MNAWGRSHSSRCVSPGRRSVVRAGAVAPQGHWLALSISQHSGGTVEGTFLRSLERSHVRAAAEPENTGLRRRLLVASAGGPGRPRAPLAEVFPAVAADAPQPGRSAPRSGLSATSCASPPLPSGLRSAALWGCPGVSEGRLARPLHARPPAASRSSAGARRRASPVLSTSLGASLGPLLGTMSGV
ncbi:uncharacterized protein LOC144312779 [Canis aureus]